MTNPLKLAPRIRQAYEALDELEARERWTRDEVERYQIGRINEVWDRARRQVPYYRSLADEHDLPPSFGSVEEYTSTMPLLSKDVIRADPRALLAGDHGRGSWHPTSGSTGTPLEFFWSHDAHREVLRSRYRFYASWGVDILDPTAFVWGGGERGGWGGRRDRVVQVVQDRLRRRLRLSASAPSVADLERIVAHGPTMLYGYTQAVHVLARSAAEADMTFPSLRAVVVTGEAAGDGVLADIRDAFGVPAVVEYGATESMLIAGSASDGMLQVREDLVLVETLPSDHGGFDVVLTVLTNHDFPMLRYLIEDVSDSAIVRPDRGFARLGRVTGRSDDLVIASTGVAVHPTAFDALFEERADQVQRYRVHQSADGRILVSVVPASPGSFRDEASVRRELQDVVGTYPLTLEVVDGLAASDSGKRRVVRSELAAAGR